MKISPFLDRFTPSHGRRGRVRFDLFRQDVEHIVLGVEGEQFANRLGYPAQFVVLEMGRTRPLASAVGQVAVVAVAAFDGGVVRTANGGTKEKSRLKIFK